MKRAARAVSLAALVMTILPPLLFFADRMDAGAMRAWMFAAAVAWFGSAPFWMKKS